MHTDGRDAGEREPGRDQLLTSWLVLVLMALAVIVGLVLLALGGAGA